MAVVLLFRSIATGLISKSSGIRSGSMGFTNDFIQAHKKTEWQTRQ